MDIALKTGASVGQPTGAGKAAAGAAPRPDVLPGDTIPQKFWHAVQLRGSKVALRQKELGIWQEVSWSEFGAYARHIAMALAAQGFQPGDVASILANTRREWSYADYGILCAGGVSAGIYPTDAATQVEYVLSDSGSSVVFVEDDEQLDKVLQVRERLPKLRRIVVFDMEGLSHLQDPQVTSLEAFEKAGAAFDAGHPGEFDRRLSSRKADDLAILVYTSGTTGKPKGAMISHRNLRAGMEWFPDELEQTEDDDRMAFLPLCHIFERAIGQFIALESGARLNYVENPDTVAENIREIAPTIMAGVPRIYEKFMSGISIRVRESTRFEQWAYKTALGIGYKVADLKLADKPVPAGLAALFWIARFLVLENVCRMIGLHRVRFALTGAAPISPEIIRWYFALGVNMYEGWGMSETSATGSLNLPGKFRLGSIGKPLPYVQMRIGEGDEIQIRGDSIFMGYLNMPEKTREAFTEDGWMRTGDVGTVDADGFFRITDRMKDIIITAGGKNITPSELENELKFSPYITDAVVIGDKRPYLTCLIMIDHENVENYAQENSVPFSDFASLTRTREVQDLIQAEIDRVNARFARVEQIKKFRLIDHKLTPEDEELTPTMKLKRKLVNEKYKALIDSMYAGG